MIILGVGGPGLGLKKNWKIFRVIFCGIFCLFIYIIKVVKVIVISVFCPCQ